MEKVKNSLQYEYRRIKSASLGRWIVALLIVVVFILIPSIGLDAYYKYADSTNYYQIQNPVQVKQDDINSCDTITLNFMVNSKIETSGVSHRALYQVDVINGQVIRVGSSATDIPITKTDGFVLKPIQILVPCGLPNGNYYFSSVVTYEVRDIAKTTTWQSTVFKITSKESTP